MGNAISFFPQKLISVTIYSLSSFHDSCRAQKLMEELEKIFPKTKPLTIYEFEDQKAVYSREDAFMRLGVNQQEIPDHCSFYMEFDKLGKKLIGVHSHYENEPFPNSISLILNYRSNQQIENYIKNVFSFFNAIESTLNPILMTIGNGMFYKWHNPVDITRRLPHPEWFVYFGNPYLNFWGKEKILQAPVYKVFTDFSCGIGLQLTADLTQPVSPKISNDLVSYLNVDSFTERDRAQLNHPTVKDNLPQLDFSQIKRYPEAPFNVHKVLTRESSRDNIR